MHLENEVQEKSSFSLVKKVSQNISPCILSSSPIKYAAQEMHPILSPSFIINQTLNIDLFPKFLTFPNPTDIGHFNYINQFSDT